MESIVETYSQILLFTFMFIREFVSDYVFRMQVKEHLNDDQRPQFFKASKISKKRNLPTVTFKNINPNAKVEFTTGYKRELLEEIYCINEEV